MAALETVPEPPLLPLSPIGQTQIDGLAALLPPATARLAVCIVEPLSVLSMRHRPGDGSAALARALAAHGLAGLPEPGCALGSDPWALWCSPGECRVLTRDAALARALAAAVADAAPPGDTALACAIDISPGCITLELRGDNARALLSRLADASAWPAAAGQARRARLAGVVVLVFRVRDDGVWLVADRAHGHFLMHWLLHAAGLLAQAGR